MIACNENRLIGVSLNAQMGIEAPYLAITSLGWGLNGTNHSSPYYRGMVQIAALCTGVTQYRSVLYVLGRNSTDHSSPYCRDTVHITVLHIGFRQYRSVLDIWETRYRS